MNCLECGAAGLDRLDNEHLLACSGLTVHEYAIRHRQPLDLLLHPDQINREEGTQGYGTAVRYPGERARATLRGLRWAGLVRPRGEFVEVPGEIRRLDLLLSDLEALKDYGFQFRQDYRYGDDSHRVVAHNCLRAPRRNLLRHWTNPEPLPNFLDALATYLAHVAEFHAGYFFMQFPKQGDAEDVRVALDREHGVRCLSLNAADHPEGALLRTETLDDGEALLSLMADRLRRWPGAAERFLDSTPEATVSKELVFDAAHFISDHPAKCSNLHGGRYVLHVEVTGRLDPVTGCVVDYGYLKRVVNGQVIDRFDHHTLNYAAAELAWRSSTEMICVHIWECLIDYLPGLSGLKLYETTQSWCDYQGPTLAEFQAQGSAAVLHPFAAAVDRKRRRALIRRDAELQAVRG